jgi:hypothetical protein
MEHKMDNHIKLERYTRNTQQQSKININMITTITKPKDDPNPLKQELSHNQTISAMINEFSCNLPDPVKSHMSMISTYVTTNPDDAPMSINPTDNYQSPNAVLNSELTSRLATLTHMNDYRKFLQNAPMPGNA